MVHIMHSGPKCVLQIAIISSLFPHLTHNEMQSLSLAALKELRELLNDSEVAEVLTFSGPTQWEGISLGAFFYLLIDQLM